MCPDLYTVKSTEPQATINLGQEITSASLAPFDSPYALLCAVGQSALVMVTRSGSQLVERNRHATKAPSARILCVSSHPKDPSLCAVGTDSGSVYLCTLN